MITGPWITFKFFIVRSTSLHTTIWIHLIRIQTWTQRGKNICYLAINVVFCYTVQEDRYQYMHIWIYISSIFWRSRVNFLGIFKAIEKKNSVKFLSVSYFSEELWSEWHLKRQNYLVSPQQLTFGINMPHLEARIFFMSALWNLF